MAILSNGQLNDTDSQTPYGQTKCQLTGAFGCMNNGDVWSVWIAEYHYVMNFRPTQ